LTDVRTYARIRVASGRECYAAVVGDTAELLDAPPWSGGTPTGESVATSDAALLCPVRPQKVFGIGKNYRAHAAEMGGDVPKDPLVFAKLTSSLAGPGATVTLPSESVRVDYEGEVAVVIGARMRRIPVERALDAVFGVTAACDITARDFQMSDGQWTRAKGFDGFCPLGPVVATGLDLARVGVRLSVNGEQRQASDTSQMVFDVAQLVAHVSSFCTLEPGDVILTGTPEGVGPLSPGDRVRVGVDGVGDLDFDVAAEAPRP
jgi:2-keto-4-pentenoate hydratase/2-oxohepta-3-ene-1,7-dioic acid hydratase in catechol pathway